MPDSCSACQGLVAEAGQVNAEFYARRLLVRGWGGTLTRAEKAYLRAYPPVWYQSLVARSHAEGSKCLTATPSSPEVVG